MMATMKEAADIAEEAARVAVSDMNEGSRDKTGTSEEGHWTSMVHSVADALRHAKEALTGNVGSAALLAEDAVLHKGGDHPSDVGHPKDKYAGTEFEARRIMEDTKLDNQGRNDEDKKIRDEARKETAADRGIAAKKTIYGAMGSQTDALKEKSKMPIDIVEEAHGRHEHGDPEKRGGYSGLDVEDIVRGSGY